MNVKNISYKKISPPVKDPSNNSSDKILVNPYHGCSHNCLFCPANNGFLNKKAFDDYRQYNVIHVVENIIEHLEISLAHNDNPNKVVHLSPVADPFQPAEKLFGLSQQVVQYCLEHSIPVGICTKGIIPSEVINMLSCMKNSFVQISIPTHIEKKHKQLIRGDGATVDELFTTIKVLSENQINTIVRIDPVYPYLTDDMSEFERLIEKLKDYGISCVLSSVADLVNHVLEREYHTLESIEIGLYERYKQLYTEHINGRWHAKLEYRDRIFKQQQLICKKHQMSYGITWEPDITGNSINQKYNYIYNDNVFGNTKV